MNDAILNLLIYIIEFNLFLVANLLCVNSRNPLKKLMIKFDNYMKNLITGKWGN